MSRGAAATSLGDEVKEAAESALLAGGSAVDAVVAAFLAGAGVSPEVLLAPVVALVAGPGVGGRAFDGRAAQPGSGAPRPRGYAADVEPPPAARVGAPRSLPMLAVLHSYHGRAQLRSLAGGGVDAATARGAVRRAQLLRAFAESGARVMQTGGLRAALLAAAGPIAGGALSQRDLDEARPVDVDAAVEVLERGRALRPPWPAPDARRAEIVVAADAWGVVAALAIAPSQETVPVPELELVASADAAPVRRGVTRLPPGTPIAAPAPIAVLVRDAADQAPLPGVFRLALGAPDAGELSLDALRRMAVAPMLDRAAVTGPWGSSVAVAWDGREPKGFG